MHKIEDFLMLADKLQGELLWDTFNKQYDYLKAPFESSKLLRFIENKLNSKLKKEEIRGFLRILRLLKKDELFDPRIIVKYLKVKDSGINSCAIHSLSYSYSELCDNVLLDCIAKPKSDRLGELAAKTLHFEIQSIKSFDKLLKLYPNLKKETKRAAGFLIYTKSFDNNLYHSTELKKFFIQNKIKSLKKWTFKNWKEIKFENADSIIWKRITKLLESKSIKNKKSEMFYIPISEYSYIGIRSILQFPFEGKVGFDFSIRSFVVTYRGWIRSESPMSFSASEGGLSQIDLNSPELKNYIVKFKETIIKSESNLDKKYLEVEKNILKRGLYNIESLVNYALFKERKNLAEEWSEFNLKENHQNLKEYWVRYYKEIKKITVTNTSYDALHSFFDK